MTDAYVEGEIYATSGIFSGTVQANEGYIGGFNIQNNILTTSSSSSGIWFDSVRDNYVRIKLDKNSYIDGGLRWFYWSFRCKQY